MPEEEERRPRRNDDRGQRGSRPSGGGRSAGDRGSASQGRQSGYDRDGSAPRRDGGAPRREGGYNRDGGAPRRDGGGTRRDGGYKREGGESRGRSFPQRGGADRERSIHSTSERVRHDEPSIPEEITARDLHPSARNELKTLSKENAEHVARHLAMASRLIDEDPELAHAHALAASRSAGRIAIVRETLGITAYATGDFALALRELRTYRRISGKDDQIALMVDSERGIGRPDRALETGRAVDRSALRTPVRVALAIAMSGARLDQGDLELALGELEIPELDPDRAFEWSPALFAARAAVLEDLDRTEEAAFWTRRAEVAAEALGIDEAGDEEIFVEDGLIEDEEGDETDEANENRDADEASADDASSVDPDDVTDDVDAASDGNGHDQPALESEPTVEDEVRELLGEDGPEGPDRAPEEA